MKEFLTYEDLGEYPKSVLLAAIHRRTLVMPTRRELEYAYWESETQAGMADMNAAIAAQKSLGPLPNDASYEQFAAHHEKSMALHAAFDAAADRIERARARWERAQNG